LGEGQRVVTGEQPAPVVGVPELVEARLVRPVLVLALGSQQGGCVVRGRACGQCVDRRHQPRGGDGGGDDESEAKTGRQHW
jgi:hypothetical protein